MTIQELLDVTLVDTKITIYDEIEEKELFKGEIDEVPENLLDVEVGALFPIKDALVICPLIGGELNV